MTQQPVTHFKYICRVCQKEILQPVLQEDPAGTPHPSCCGRQRNMAYKGVHTDGQGEESGTARIDSGGRETTVFTYGEFKQAQAGLGENECE